MKKMFLLILTLLLLLPVVALAEGVPTEPVTWEYLLTIAGCAVMTVLIVQLLKLPLDRVWKIPTQIVVFVIALIIMLLATHFVTGLTWSNGLLAVFNSVIAALTAIGMYEVTLAKLEKK